MKSPVKHIFLKDLKRFWPRLTLWSVALLMHAILPGWMEVAAPGSTREEGMFASILVLLINVQLVVNVLAEDSALREGAFWRTRPISGGQMLAAKVFFLGVWTLLLPALVTVAAAIAYGFSLGETVEVVLWRLVMHGALGGGFLLVSIFTQRVLSSMLVAWLFLTLMGSWFSIQGQLKGTHSSNEVEWGGAVASLATTRAVIAIAAALAGAGAAVWLVYRDRRRGAAAVATGIGLTVAWVALAAWPLDLLGWVPSLRRLTAEPSGNIRAVADRVEVNKAGTNVKDKPLKRVEAMLRWSGLADGEVCVVYKVEGKLIGADGKERAQALRLRSGEGRARAGFQEALSALGTDRLVGLGQVGSAIEFVTLAEASAAEFTAFRGAGVEWRGCVYARVGTLTPEWRMPLHLGEKWSQGAARARIVDGTQAGDDANVVVVWERAIDLPRWMRDANATVAEAGWSIQPYVLINAARGEFVLPVGGGGANSRDGLFKTTRRQMIFRLPDSVPVSDWREGAELVKLRFDEKRRVKVELSVPVDFTLER